MENTEKQRPERARAYFEEGYNCAQAVLMAFEDKTGLDKKSAAAMASGFGGGMGRLREVCGAFSSAVLVLNILLGYTDPKDRMAKAVHYARVQRMAADFRAEKGTIICRELLGLTAPSSPIPEQRTQAYYQKRPCPDLVALATAVVQAELLRPDPEVTLEE